jgi:hypothetical protein
VEQREQTDTTNRDDIETKRGEQIEQMDIKPAVKE